MTTEIPAEEERYLDFYTHKKDGTTKQTNPFTGTVVWTMPSRSVKRISANKKYVAGEHHGLKPLKDCVFCSANYMETPPEKARIVKGDNSLLRRIGPHEIFDTIAEFRRVPNLFELVSFDYWAKNYDYELSPDLEEHKSRYLSTATGREHVIRMIDLKLEHDVVPKGKIWAMSDAEKMIMANAFFGGGHELIIPERHTLLHDQTKVFSSGDMTPEEHYRYFCFTIDGIRDIFAHIRYAPYVSVFQNWLPEAGTSVEHLHKQLVAIDDRGVAIRRELKQLRRNKNAYNDDAANFAAYRNLMLAENDHAIAFVDIGHRYPTVAIFSKSRNTRPQEHEDEEVRSVSDLVHACHAAIDRNIPCNEEWYYQPRDLSDPIPWHILIKWRPNVSAGFEGGTRIYINPITPEDLRDQIVPKLFELKNSSKISTFPIAFECSCETNCLRYVEG